jgi:hypothetical protein
MDRTSAQPQVYLNLLRSNSLQFKSLGGERTQLWRQQRKLWASYYVVPLRSQHSNNNIPTHTLFLLILPNIIRAQYLPTHICLYGHFRSYTVGKMGIEWKKWETEPSTNTQHLGVSNSNHQQLHCTVNSQHLTIEIYQQIYSQPFKTNTWQPTANKWQLQKSIRKYSKI